MKKNALLLTILLSTCACNNDSSLLEKPKDIDIILLSGQSNAEGHSETNYLLKKIDEETKNKCVNGFDHTLIRYKLGAFDTSYSSGNFNRMFEKVSIGQGGQITRFGPEIGMAKFFDENYSTINKEIYIVKFAVGGTSIYYDWRSPSSSNSLNATGPLYESMMYFIDEVMGQLKKQNFNPTIQAICWMQGESDSDSKYSFYEELEDNLINDLTTDLAKYGPKDEKIKFVDALISQSSMWTNYYEINQAKKANQTKDENNRFCIDTIEEKLTYDLEPEVNPDLCHYDALSMVKLGELFARTLIENSII